MIFSFFESVKYVGHLLPLVLLRVFLGYFYLLQAWGKFSGDYLSRPRVAEQISEFLPLSEAASWFKYFVSTQMVPHWQVVAFIIVGLEFAIGVSYLIGYVVRPMALIAAILAFFIHYISPSGYAQMYMAFMGIHLTLSWIGAGRCVGLDYYFYKRRRGIWW